MKLKVNATRNVAVRKPVKFSVVLNFDDHKKLEAFVALLAQIDKRARATNPKMKKVTFKNTKKDSHNSGSFLLLVTVLSLRSIHNTFITVITHMIDTIVFLLDSDTFQITEPDKFVPSARWITNSSTRAVHVTPSKQNPTKKELRAGIYKPRVTLLQRPLNGHPVITLKVELSLPKLLYGNNFQELKGKDLQPLLQKLAATLEHMGVVVTADDLSAAHVCSVHYAKNIPLTDGTTPYQYINKIKEANIKWSLDVNQTDYRNDGHSYKWHCNAYEVVFYDKIKDLEKAKQSEKRALEKDNALQMNLFAGFKNRKRLEILRMEVRLNKRPKIKQLFKTLGIKTNLTLKGLFKPSISKKVLLHYLDELESKRPALLDYKALNDKALLAALVLNNPTFGPKRILQTFGLAKALDVANVRELRGMFGNYSQRSWARLMAEAKDVILPGAQSPLGVIRRHVEKFASLKGLDLSK